MPSGKVPENSTLLVFYAAANHDEEQFPDAERFDIGRFGDVGSNEACLAARLADARGQRLGLVCFFPRKFWFISSKMSI